MLILCPRCSKRYEFVKSHDEQDFLCSCGTKIINQSCNSFKQMICSSEAHECPYCAREYDFESLRDNSIIACDCGNILIVSNPDISTKNESQRKNDRPRQLLEKELLGLVDTSRVLHSSIQDIDKLMRMTVRTTTEMLNVEGCSVVIRNKEKDELVLYAIIDKDSSELASFKIPDDGKFVTKTIENRTTLVINDFGKTDGNNHMAESVGVYKTRNMLCVPLIVEEECVGELELVNAKKPEGFTQHDVLLANTVASQIAVAIHNYQLAQKSLKAERRAAMGQAVWEVAHCVKNMLNGLQGGLYIVKSDIKRSDATIPDDGFVLLERNLGRLKDMVYDMLSSAKDRKPQLENVDITEVIDQVVDIIKPKASELNVGFELCYDDNLGKMMIDPKGIYRCFLNLISNGLDASKENPGSAISISTKALSDDWAEITIADQGQGIDADTLESMFKPFFSTKKSEGTGLGLSVTQKIINEHGGTVNVESKPGNGAKFMIKLPRK
ncbi:MAG: GAF domain-containing protein [Fibrobacteria bacterium]|nr:GAF domain-containing protein [Fibrobacteria bacterium]